MGVKSNLLHSWALCALGEAILEKLTNEQQDKLMDLVSVWVMHGLRDRNSKDEVISPEMLQNIRRSIGWEGK